MSDESFIPYEQLEPLLRPGMTGRELAAAVLTKMGLGTEYALHLKTDVLPLKDGLRDGVFVVKHEDVRTYFDAGDEVMA